MIKKYIFPFAVLTGLVLNTLFLHSQILGFVFFGLYILIVGVLLGDILKSVFSLREKYLSLLLGLGGSVICIAEGYNKFDLDTVEILPIKIELLEYIIYATNILQLNLEKQQKFKIGTSKLYKNTKKDKVDRLQKIYSVEDHLGGTKDEIKKLFFEIREMITTLDNDIVEEPKKLYIAYKLATNFVDIEIRSKDIKIFLNVPVGHLNDKFELARDVSKTGHWGNGDYEVKISPKSDLEPIFELIKQSYEYNK